MSIKDQIQSSITHHSKEIAAYALIMNVVEEMGLADAEFYLDAGTSDYGVTPVSYKPYIKLTPKHVSGIAIGMGYNGPSLSLSDASPTMGDAARILLPKVGRWEKSFDEKNNLLTLTGMFNGVRVVIRDTPPDTCTVEKIEEEVEVPEKVIVAHTEKKVRYVLKGDCDPLLSARTVQSEVVEVPVPDSIQSEVEKGSEADEF